MSKYGIAISVYFGQDTHPNRLNIFLASIHTLLASGFDGKIVIVDDASPTSDHLHKLYDVTDRIQYIKRTENVGIAECKNECIKALSDCDCIFLADDDMLYNGKWWELYINASEKTGIEHFSFYVPQPYHKPFEIIDYKGVKLTKYDELNGCLLFFTQKSIKTVGMFKHNDNKHFLEHPMHTQRCVDNGLIPFYCDVNGIRNYVRLNKSSYEGKSMQVNHNTKMQYDNLYANTANYGESNLTGNPLKWIPMRDTVVTMDKNMSIVDLGCGRGFYLRQLHSLGHKILGVEQSTTCCNKYLQDIPHINLPLADFLSSNKDAYDLVISTDVLEHIHPDDIDGIISGISKLSNKALLGITNSSDRDPLNGTELHLCIHDVLWWTQLLSKHYKKVTLIPDKVTYHNEYFLLKCEQ
jgi:2-polyprenyl-3-methyl-5-hydroxy-6-metoxy-1,4-benzoquinol methylase